MIGALAFLRTIPRLLNPTGWLIVAVIAAFVLTGAYCSHRGAQSERDRKAVETHKTDARGGRRPGNRCPRGLRRNPHHQRPPEGLFRCGQLAP